MIYLLPIIFLIQGYFSFHPSLNSVCSLGSVFNCETVLNSPYAFVGGIPLWSIGLAWSIVAILRKHHKDLLGSLLKVSAGLAVVYSLGTMIFVIKSFCILCLVSDALLIYYISRHGEKNEAIQGRGFFEILMALVFTGVSFGALFLTVETIKTEKIFLLSSPLILGNPQGSKDVVIFTDFQCPACAQSSNLVRDILLKNPDVKIIIKHYPLSSKCNEGVKEDIHPWACEAAKIAYCAFEQGRFMDFYNLIYAGQTEVSGVNNLYQLLDDGKFNIPELKACTNSESSTQAIKRDIDEGNAIGIEATPTFFYKGQQVLQWNNPYVWKDLISR